MNDQEVLMNAKRKCSICKVCPTCNGVVCAGWIPGIGGKGNGASFKRNYAKLREYTLKMDTLVSEAEVDCRTTLFGREVSMPIYAAPLGDIGRHFGCEIDDLTYTKQLMEGATLSKTIVFTGDGKSIEVFLDPLSVINHFDNGICTIKPWEAKGLYERLNAANDSNALAIASDIDAAGLPFLRNSELRVEFKSKEALSEMIAHSNKPFIVKGILSLEGAKKAYEAGADGIIISNHGGRVLDECASSIEVLEAIADVYKDQMTILIDGGFRSGSDVFKAMALGADGVLIGRPLSIAVIGGGSEGANLYFQKIKAELIDCMQMCGCKKVQDISKTHIYK